MRIFQVNHDCRVHCINWPRISDEADSFLTSGFLTFATGGADGKIRLFRLGTGNDGSGNKVQVMAGHSDYVNSVCFEPETCSAVASGSDDGTVAVHDLNSQQRHVVTFESPVMVVQWHPDRNEAKIMVISKTCYEIIS